MDTPQHFQRVEALFDQAMEHQPDARLGYLQQACGDDEAELIEEVLQLLSLADHSVAIACPIHNAETSDVELFESDPFGAPSSIGPYRLTRKLGEGGFGIVYEAEQTTPMRRRVALKLIRPGMDSRQVVARFDVERQALALMDHPGIARVLDAGTTEVAHGARPYFVMELVAGVPLTQFCDEGRLDITQRLELFIQVCQAVQHAHQKGVIHRDLKPSNVLVVTDDEGRPIPKVIDFGIAKAIADPLTDQTFQTQQSQLIGTPKYMSPEQADPHGVDIDTRSDVYSLGVILYELLTGAAPFEETSIVPEMMRRVREEDPRKPSTRVAQLSDTGDETAAQRRTDPRKLEQLIRGDLDWIVMTCLEKDRALRYDTANGLARDLQCYLANEPVSAGPPSTSYRLRKFVRRNRAAVVAGSLIATALLLGSIGTTAGMIWAFNEKGRAEHELMRSTEVKRFLTDMLGSVDPEVARGRDTTLLREILDKAAARLEEGEITDALIEAELRSAVGNTYIEIGEIAIGGRLLEPAWKIRRELLGHDALETLESMFDVAYFRYALGDFDEALVLNRATLDARRRVLGNDHPDTIQSMIEVGDALLALGHVTECGEYYEEALTRSRSAFGDRHRSTAIALHSMGTLARNRGLFQEAEGYYRESLEVDRELLGDDHVNTLTSLIELATVLHEQAKLTEAEERFNQALGMCRRIFGPDHPRTAGCLNNLASLLQSQQRLEEAEPLLREAMEGLRRVKGPDHPDVLLVTLNVGSLLLASGDYSEAERLYREVLAASQRALEADHPVTLFALNNLGMVAYRQEKMGEAETFFTRALEIRRRVHGDDHPNTLVSIANLAGLLLENRRLEGAETLYREALEGRRRRLGESHPSTLNTLANLAAVLDRTGAYAEAIDLRSAGVATVRSLSPPDSSLLSSHLAAIAETALSSDDPEHAAVALAAARESLQLRRELFADDDPQVWKRHNAASFVGDALLANARLNTERSATLALLHEAESLLVDSAEAMIADPTVPLARRRWDAGQRVIDLYEFWHDTDGTHADQAAAWRARLEAAQAKDATPPS